VATARAGVVRNEIEAELACSMLRLEGIECFSKRTNMSVGAGDGSSALAGPFEVWVAEENLEQARELLEAQPPD
jgi:hypothetical protein